MGHISTNLASLLLASVSILPLSAASPVADAITSPVLTNPGGSLQARVPVLTGNDAEDGAYSGAGSDIIKIQSLATNGTLYYNGTAVTLGQVINNYDPLLLTVDPASGAVTVAFNYSYVDTDGNISPAATVTMPFKLPGTAPACAGNLLLNPSFETTSTGALDLYSGFTPANWSSSTDFGYPELRWTVPDGISFLGIYTPGAVVYQDVSSSPGSCYSLTFYAAMHEPTLNDGEVKIQYLDSSHNPIGSPVAYKITHDWETTEGLGGPYSLSLGTAPAGTSFVRVFIENNSAPGTVESVKADGFCLLETCKSLPVTLVNFNAKEEGHSTVLNWVSSSETNSSYYQVQHSLTSRSWRSLGQVTASQNSSSMKSYSFRDDGPAPGINYYRLRIVDLDGTATYSSVRSVVVTGRSDTRIFPNPSSGVVNIEASDWSDVNNVQVLTFSGKIVYDSGQNPRPSIFLNQTPAGAYLIKLARVSGWVETKRIIIAR